MLNLDTHILVRALTGDVIPRELVALSGDSWGISAIVLWELFMLARLGRIEYDFEDGQLSLLLSRNTFGRSTRRFAGRCGSSTSRAIQRTKSSPRPVCCTDSARDP